MKLRKQAAWSGSGAIVPTPCKSNHHPPPPPPTEQHPETCRTCRMVTSSVASASRATLSATWPRCHPKRLQSTGTSTKLLVRPAAAHEHRHPVNEPTGSRNVSSLSLPSLSARPKGRESTPRVRGARPLYTALSGWHVSATSSCHSLPF